MPARNPPSPDTVNEEKRSSESLERQLSEHISGDNFDRWYRNREYRENILQGQSYFNKPKQPKEPNYHTPSKLLKCHRKTVYDQLAVPKEISDPTGIFWMGEMIEEELILPFLQDLVKGKEAFVTNSIWISTTLQMSGRELEIKGASDPVFVDAQSVPILPTEVKSRKSLEYLEEPSQPHLAQTHAYMLGLSRKFETEIREALIIYVGREELDVRVFRVDFDQRFWDETVCTWIDQQSKYRREKDLPPAKPLRQWECDFCGFRERCGKGDREYQDIAPGGFLPFFIYPREVVTEYLEGHPDEKLTPTLALVYPELPDMYPVYRWVCGHCSSSFQWDSVDWDGDLSSAPLCPNCLADRNLQKLTAPSLPAEDTEWTEQRENSDFTRNIDG